MNIVTLPSRERNVQRQDKQALCKNIIKESSLNFCPIYVYDMRLALHSLACLQCR